MVNQLEKNAATVAARLASDWANAYVIACSVKKGVGNGVNVSGPNAPKAPLGRGASEWRR